MRQPKNEEMPTSKQKRGNLTSGLTLARRLRPNKNKLAPQQQSEPEQNESTTDSFYYNQRNLQLIASKCRCEFYMIDFDDKLPNGDERGADINDISTLHQHQSLNSNMINSELYEDKRQNQTFIDLNGSFNEPIDCFTLIHSDLNLCTNSKQYKMIMDLVNNLVLYFRPRRKQVIDKQKSIKFNLQLSMGNLN